MYMLNLSKTGDCELVALIVLPITIAVAVVGPILTILTRSVSWTCELEAPSQFVGKEDEKIKWEKDDNKAYTVLVGVRRKWRRKE
ncbi:MAG: hypothetical protein ACXQTW_03935 [Candidatus Methanospirareceae archaeon]